MKSWLKEPMLHFLLAGCLLFGIYAWLNPSVGARGTEPRQVRIGEGEIKWLTEMWMRQWQREPTSEEMRGLVTGLLKEELLSREAREMGLGEGDTIVRRRLAQKLEFLLQDTARLAEPIEHELRRFHEAQNGRFQTTARVSFTQIYFNPERRKNATGDAEAALARLSMAPSATAAVGDRLLVEGELHDADERTVAGLFGPGFAGAVFALKPGAWHGPIASGYGVHLVQVTGTTPARQQPFEEVKAQVLETWREQNQREIEQRFFTRLTEKYEVVIHESVKPLVGPLTLLRSGG